MKKNKLSKPARKKEPLDKGPETATDAIKLEESTKTSTNYSCNCLCWTNGNLVHKE